MGSVFKAGSTMTTEGCPDFVRVKGVSGKGKNRVREHGDVWQVIGKTSHAVCRQGQPSFLVVPKGKEWIESCIGHWWRWVSLKNDPDFSIEEELSND